MIRSEESGLIEGFIVGKGRTRVLLLRFADDIIFFFKVSRTSTKPRANPLGFWAIIRFENQFREVHSFRY